MQAKMTVVAGYMDESTAAMSSDRTAVFARPIVDLAAFRSEKKWIVPAELV